MFSQQYTLYLYCVSNTYLIHKTNFHCGGEQTFVFLSEEVTHDLPTGTFLNKMVHWDSDSEQRETEKSTISMRLWGRMLAHQSGICRRPFHWSVSGRWSCSSRDCGGGRTGHKADCTWGHWRREDRCKRTPQVWLTPDTELHLDRARNHILSRPRHSLLLSSPESKNTLDAPEKRKATVILEFCLFSYLNRKNVLKNIQQQYSGGP